MFQEMLVSLDRCLFLNHNDVMAPGLCRPTVVGVVGTFKLSTPPHTSPMTFTVERTRAGATEVCLDHRGHKNSPRGDSGQFLLGATLLPWVLKDRDQSDERDPFFS